MPQVFINREYKFPASVTLSIENEDGILQSHNYEMRVSVEGKIGKDGLVMHTNKIDDIVNKRVLSIFMNTHLNKYLDNPTIERIAKYTFEVLKTEIPNLYDIEIWENRNEGISAIYRE